MPPKTHADARFPQILPAHAHRLKASKKTASHVNEPPTGGRHQCSPVCECKKSSLHRIGLDGLSRNEKIVICSRASASRGSAWSSFLISTDTVETPLIAVTLLRRCSEGKREYSN